MSTILPIPTGRVSDFLTSQRLVRQIQSDQRDLFRIQTQLSTGRRVISPSDDAPAALRAINIQRLLERKAQAQTSLSSTVSYLSATDNAIGSVTNTLNDIRSAALGVDDSVTTNSARLAVVDQIDRAIQDLVNIGNTRFRERYLFSGSRSLEAPYEFQDNFVEYRGNEGALRSFVDIGFLYETNLPGSEVFGGLAEQVRGTVDLDPQLHRDTQLRDLNGGAGVSNGAIELVYIDSDNNSTSTIIDLSAASTVEDVARYLEAGAPAGSGITVEVTSTGLTLSTGSASEQLLTREVAEGRTARDLGILFDTPQPVAAGQDITPALLKTTSLSDLLGTRAQTTLVSTNTNNDLLISATQNGERVDPDDPLSDPLNGVTVQFVDGATQGNETALYDPGTATLTVTIDAGQTTAAEAAAAINAEASGRFSAEIDFRDADSPTLAGQGPIQLSATATTTGGSGEALDQNSGLLISNGGDPVTIDISAAETVEDLINILNQAGLGLQTEINAAKNGINIRSRLSGADLTIGEVAGGQTATQLGVRTLTESTRLDGFNRGLGVVVDGEAELVIELTTAGVPTTYAVDLTSANTVEDVLAAIAAETGGNVTGALAANGNGLVLTDNTGADSLRVAGQAAQYLGFFEQGDTDSTSTTGSLTASDRNTLEVESTFNTLTRLREALINDDFPAIGREISRIDQDLDRVNFARSEIGARLQSLEALQARQEDEEIALRSALSQEIDVDLAEAISEFTNRQFALQASLQTSANLLQLSILNFI